MRAQPSSSTGSGSATRPSGPAPTRRSGSAGSTSRGACASASRSCAAFADGGRRRGARRRRPARDGRLEPRAEVMRRTFGVDLVPRPRHDASAGDPRARGDDRSRAHAVRLRVEVRLDARDALAHRLLLGADRQAAATRFVAITDPGSALERLAQERGFRHVFPGEPTIGGRYSALSPFGIVPAALMGVDVDRLLASAEEMAEACRRDDGNPGFELGLGVRRGLAGGPRQDLHRRHRRRLRPLGRAADRRVDRQAGQGARPGARRVARTAPTGRPRAPQHRRPVRRSAASSSAGSSRSPSPARYLEINPFDQPDVQAAKDKTNEVLATGRRARRSSRRARSTSCSRRRSEGDYVCVQAFVDPTPENDRRIADLVAQPAAAQRPRRHARLRPALPALDRPAAQGRPEHRALPPGRRRPRRRAGDSRQAVRVPPPDPRAGRGRLRVAAGARPPCRAHPHRGELESRCSSG